MDSLYSTLYMLYTKELLSLNIGHPLNSENVNKMLEVIGDILILKNI